MSDAGDPNVKMKGVALWQLMRDTVNAHAHCQACALQAATNVLADLLCSIPDQALRDHDLAAITRELPQVVANKLAARAAAPVDTIGDTAGSA